jgi:hypothetical protein
MAESTGGPSIEVEKISIREAITALGHLSLKSFFAVVGLLIAVVGGVWSAGVWFGHQQVDATTGNPGEPVIASVRQSGLTSARDGLSNEQLKAFLIQAHTTIRVIVPWFIDPLTARDALEDILTRPDAKIEIFFLDPKSPHLVERGRVARPDVMDYGPKETKRSVLLLAPEFAHSKATARIFFYDSIPAAFIAQADNNGLLGFHMHTGVALKNPVLYFDMEREGKSTAMGRMAAGEFDKVREIAKEIIPASVTEDLAGNFIYKEK